LIKEEDEVEEDHLIHTWQVSSGIHLCIHLSKRPIINEWHCTHITHDLFL